MVAYLTRYQLIEYNRFRKSSSDNLTKSDADVTVFLSHSHRDRHLVGAIHGWLNSQGVNAYVVKAMNSELDIHKIKKIPALITPCLPPSCRLTNYNHEYNFFQSKYTGGN